MTVHDEARLKMIENQLRPNKVTDERVLDAFGRIRRELFVPPTLRGVAYVDDDLPLGGGRSLMQPMVAARLLQAAAVQPKDAALVVGAGVGYEAALLSLLARSVVALEENSELAQDRPLGPGRPPASPRSAMSRRRWRQGIGSGRPTTSSCSPERLPQIPPEIEGQLAEGGRIAVVLRPHDGCRPRHADNAHWRSARAPRYI